MSWSERGRCLVVLGAISLLLLSACGKDPAVRKQQHYDKGVKYLAEGKYNEAVIELRVSLQVDPSFAEARPQLALAYKRKGWLSDACYELDKAVQARPGFHEARVELGQVLLELGLVADAEQAARAILTADPTYARAHALLGGALARQRKLDEALRAFAAALEVDPKLVEAHVGIGTGHLARGDTGAAEEAFQRALAVNANSADAHLGLGRVRMATNRAKEAEAEFQTVLKIDPDHRAARLALALLLAQQRRADEAIQVLAVVSEKIQDICMGLVLAELYLLKGQADKAEAALAPYTKRFAEVPAVRFLMGQIALAQRKGAAAVDAFEAVAKTQPNSAVVQALLAAAYSLAGRPKEALAALQATRRSPLARSQCLVRFVPGGMGRTRTTSVAAPPDASTGSRHSLAPDRARRHRQARAARQQREHGSRSVSSGSFTRRRR